MTIVGRVLPTQACFAVQSSRVRAGEARVGGVHPAIRSFLLGGLIIESKEKALAAVVAAQEKKGHNLTVIDLEGECSYADYLVIISATNERQTAAIAEAISESLQEEHGTKPLYREGQGGWVLLDYGDVIVHVFIDDARAFYDLDRLWSKSPRLPIPLPAREPVQEVVERERPQRAMFARRRR
jgi:ribosome-associated protein